MTSSLPTLERSLRERETDLHAGRMLLAEDDVEMRRLVAATFRNDHYEVVEAGDGAELLECLWSSRREGKPVDVVVSDLRMPRLTGLQVLRHIRLERLHMPVVLITAFGDHYTHIDAWLLGAAAVLDKPFELDTLRRLVRNLRMRDLYRKGVLDDET